MKSLPRNKLRILGGALLAGTLIIGLAIFWMSPRHKPPLERSLLRSELVLRDGTLFAMGEDRPFEGKLVENYAPGQPKLEIEIREGKVHGRSRGWYEGGQLEVEESFRKGVSQGTRTRWHENGQRKSLAEIEDGKITGPFVEWYNTGQKALEMTLRDGKPDGMAEAWHRSGALKSRVHFEHGKQVSQQFWKDSAETPVLAEVRASEATRRSVGR